MIKCDHVEDTGQGANSDAFEREDVSCRWYNKPCMPSAAPTPLGPTRSTIAVLGLTRRISPPHPSAQTTLCLSNEAVVEPWEGGGRSLMSQLPRVAAVAPTDVQPQRRRRHKGNDDAACVWPGQTPRAFVALKQRRFEEDARMGRDAVPARMVAGRALASRAPLGGVQQQRVQARRGHWRLIGGWVAHEPRPILAKR